MPPMWEDPQLETLGAYVDKRGGDGHPKGQEGVLLVCVAPRGRDP